MLLLLQLTYMLRVGQPGILHLSILVVESPLLSLKSIFMTNFQAQTSSDYVPNSHLKAELFLNSGKVPPYWKYLQVPSSLLLSAWRQMCQLSILWSINEPQKCSYINCFFFHMYHFKLSRLQQNIKFKLRSIILLLFRECAFL